MENNIGNRSQDYGAGAWIEYMYAAGAEA